MSLGPPGLAAHQLSILNQQTAAHAFARPGSRASWTRATRRTQKGLLAWLPALTSFIREGLDHLFMVPGGLIDPFLPALARHPDLKPIVATHEGGAAYMADGYARAGGRFGAALGIGGPGLCNMTTAVAAAKTDSSPVLTSAARYRSTWKVSANSRTPARRRLTTRP